MKPTSSWRLAGANAGLPGGLSCCGGSPNSKWVLGGLPPLTATGRSCRGRQAAPCWWPWLRRPGPQGPGDMSLAGDSDPRAQEAHSPYRQQPPVTSARLPRGALGVRLRAAHPTRRPRAAPAPQKSGSRLFLASLPVRTSRSRRFWNLPRACSHRLSRRCTAPPPPRVFAEAPGAPPAPWFNLRLRSMSRAPGRAPPTAGVTLVHPRLHEPPAAARGPVLLPARLLGSVLARAAVPALSSPPRPSPARGLCPPGARDCVTRLSHRNTDRSAPCVLRKCEDPYTAAALCRARAENPLSPRPGSPGCLQTGRGKM